MNVMWSCRSTLSKLNNGFPTIVKTTSKVTYVDECMSAPLYPATTQDGDLYLYEFSAV